jgi:hypothetical protein
VEDVRDSSVDAAGWFGGRWGFRRHGFATSRFRGTKQDLCDRIPIVIVGTGPVLVRIKRWRKLISPPMTTPPLLCHARGAGPAEAVIRDMTLLPAVNQLARTREAPALPLDIGILMLMGPGPADRDFAA